jgi:hypothetical protein
MKFIISDFKLKKKKAKTRKLFSQEVSSDSTLKFDIYKGGVVSESTSSNHKDYITITVSKDFSL